MHCWEFHHESRTDEWTWREYDGNRTVARQSRRPFGSFIEVFDDAKRHGFDSSQHAWYLATPSHHPCVKVIEEESGDRTRAA